MKQWLAGCAWRAASGFARVAGMATLLGVVVWLTWPTITGWIPNHEAAGPTAPLLRAIRDVAELSVLEADVEAIVTGAVDGRTGGVSCVVIARGTARIGTDLTLAEVHGGDGGVACWITLEEPRVLGVSLDPGRTEVYALDRWGLWRVLPMATHEDEAVRRALEAAGPALRGAAERDDLVQRGRERVEEVVAEAAGSLGLQIEVDWER